MNVLKDNDVRKDVLSGKRIAVIGFGAQGRAQALNLRDSHCDVVIGLRANSASWPAAQQAGLAVFETADAVRQANIVLLLVPDELQPDIYAREIGPNLKRGAYLGFAHGFAIHYGKISPAPDVNVFLAAPNGVGQLVRRQYEAGHGVPCMIAIQQDPAGNTRDVAAAYACAIGAGRAGILETTFREETETDLFAEQAVLCGGLSALIEAGFDTLVEGGYTPEMAYFGCLHEVKLLADLIHERGLAGMRAAISNTAKYGDITRGPRVIGDAARQAMRALLAEIQSGQFAQEWMSECAAGKPTLNHQARADRAKLIEQVGQRLRALMPWLNQSGGGFVANANEPTEYPQPRTNQRTTGDSDTGPRVAHRRPIPLRELEPADASGCDWPGFESPPCWFIKDDH